MDGDLVFTFKHRPHFFLILYEPVGQGIFPDVASLWLIVVLNFISILWLLLLGLSE